MDGLVTRWSDRSWRVAALAAACMLTAVGGAAAQTCDASSDQFELNACAGHALDEANAVLAEKSASILGRMTDEEAIADWKVAEDAWTAFRAAECNFAASGVRAGRSIRWWSASV